MGGNLLKTWNLPKKRIPNTEYEKIKNEILSKLKNAYKCEFPYGSRIGVAPSLRQKEDHGDLDVIIGDYLGHTVWNGEKDFGKYIVKEFGYTPIKNSNVYSFPYNGFQVDVTFHPASDYDSAINYCSWGDLSNLMGRVFHKMGLHYGHSGLSFWIRQGLFDNECNWSNNDHIYQKLVLTQHMQQICSIGGFDYQIWEKGFDTEEDAFQFVINSKYFNSELFELENLNHINRTRNRKRGMYMRFIQYLDTQTNLPKFEFLSKQNYYLIFQTRFRYLRTVIDEWRFHHTVKQLIKQKINGHKVMEIFPNITGNEIGKIMNSIQKDYSEEELLGLSDKRCIELIKHYEQIHRNNE